MPGDPALTSPQHEPQPAPTEALHGLNELAAEEARRVFMSLGGSARWAEAMLVRRPYADAEALLAAAEEAFDELADADWREAFAAHAPIGAPRDGDRRGVAEQSAMGEATPSERAAMAAGNERYQRRFGHVFLIRAAGRSPKEMLQALHTRLENEIEAEFAIAVREQREITRLRLRDSFA